jgi:hypothetical protein
MPETHHFDYFAALRRSMGNALASIKLSKAFFHSLAEFELVNGIGERGVWWKLLGNFHEDFFCAHARLITQVVGLSSLDCR